MIFTGTKHGIHNSTYFHKTRRKENRRKINIDEHTIVTQALYIVSLLFIFLSSIYYDVTYKNRVAACTSQFFKVYSFTLTITLHSSEIKTKMIQIF